MDKNKIQNINQFDKIITHRKYIPNIITPYIKLKPILLEDSDNLLISKSSYLKPIDENIPDIYINSKFKHSHFKEFICFANNDYSLFMTNLGSIIINPEIIDTDLESPFDKVDLFGLKIPVYSKNSKSMDFNNNIISNNLNSLILYDMNLLQPNYFTLRTIIDISIDLYFQLEYHNTDISILQFFNEFFFDTDVISNANLSYKYNNPYSYQELDIVFYIHTILMHAINYVYDLVKSNPDSDITDIDYHLGVYYAILKYDKFYKSKKFSWNSALSFTTSYKFQYCDKNKFESITRMENLKFFIHQGISLLVNAIIHGLKNMSENNILLDAILLGLNIKLNNTENITNYIKAKPIWIKSNIQSLNLINNTKTQCLHIDYIINNYITPLINNPIYKTKLTKPEIEMLNPICKNPNKFKHIIGIIYGYLLIDLGYTIQALPKNKLPRYAYEILNMHIYDKNKNDLNITYQKYLLNWANSNLERCFNIILNGITNFKHKGYSYIDICGPILNIPCEFKHNDNKYQYIRIGNAPYLNIGYKMIKPDYDIKNLDNYPNNIFELLTHSKLNAKNSFTNEHIKCGIDEFTLSYNINHINKFQSNNPYDTENKYFLCSAYFNTATLFENTFPLHIPVGGE